MQHQLHHHHPPQPQTNKMFITNGVSQTATTASSQLPPPPQSSAPIQTIPECQACFQQINDRYYLQVMDKTWHLNCLRCNDCKLSLDTQQSCFAKDGFIFCKDDYFKRFPRKCHGCCQQITPNELIMRARQFVFHMHCFKCVVCDRLLNTGDEFGIGKDGSIFCRIHYFYHLEQQNDFNQLNSNTTTTNNNNNYTHHEHQQPYHQDFSTFYQQSMCNSNTNLPPTPGISPPNQSSPNNKPNTPLNSVNSSSNSNSNINSNNNNNSKGRPKKRKLNNNTSGVDQPVSKKLTANKKNNNQNNLTATITPNTPSSSSSSSSSSLSSSSSSSSSQESTNSTQAQTNNLITKNEPSNLITNNSNTNNTNSNTNNNNNNNTTTTNSLESPSDDYKNFDSNLDYFSDNEDDILDTSGNNTNNATDSLTASIAATATAGSSSSLNSSYVNPHGYYDSVAAVAAAAAAAAAAQRQKRMRTSFKHHQLRVMKSYFELNHNPDAKDLKQLSQKTGLSKRVLQVWFQNARAKYRRGQTNPNDPNDPSGLTSNGSNLNGSISSPTPSSGSTNNNNPNNNQSQHGNNLGLDLIDENESSSQSLSDTLINTANTANLLQAANDHQNSFNSYTQLGGGYMDQIHSHHQMHQMHPAQSHYQTLAPPHVNHLHSLQSQPQQQLQPQNDFNTAGLIVDNLFT